MYCIVFSGRLLDGYDSMTVRKAVADRLNLDAGQVERLFSGDKVVLKNGVTEESGNIYLNVLRRLGMDAGMVEVPETQRRVETLASFKIVFWGRILDGFERRNVMRDAARRLRTSDKQIELLFNGNKAVLKRGVSADVGSRYVVELARIGMQIELEVETTELDRTTSGRHMSGQGKNYAKDIRGVGKVQPSLSQLAADIDEMYQGLLETQYELPSLVEQGVGSSHLTAAESGLAPAVNTLRTVPTGIVMPAPDKAATSVIRHAKPADYVRCPVCGQRQPPGTRCRACGIELAKPSMVRKTIPMDASAHATPTTILGNMPTAMMRNGVAETTSSISGLDRSAAEPVLHHLREQQQRQSSLLGYAYVLIGAVLVVSLAASAWWFI